MAEDKEERRLANAIGTDDANDLPWRYAKIEVPQHDPLAKPLADLLSEKHGGTSLQNRQPIGGLWIA